VWQQATGNPTDSIERENKMSTEQTYDDDDERGTSQSDFDKHFDDPRAAFKYQREIAEDLHHWLLCWLNTEFGSADEVVEEEDVDWELIDDLRAFNKALIELPFNY
jgi:hypothetical protein